MSECSEETPNRLFRCVCRKSTNKDFAGTRLRLLGIHSLSVDDVFPSVHHLRVIIQTGVIPNSKALGQSFIIPCPNSQVT